MVKTHRLSFLGAALALFLSGCASVGSQAPTFVVGSKVTVENAVDVASFDPADAVSVVDYYFASRIRGDDKWIEVLPPKDQWSDRLREKIGRHNKWSFFGYQFQEIDDPDAAPLSVSVEMMVGFEGDTETGVDDVTLQQVDGKWTIIEVPT